MVETVFSIKLIHYLILSMILFFIGALGVVISKNVIKILIFLEIMVTAVNINFVAVASFLENVSVSGYVFVLFYTAIGAVEISVALVIFYLMFRKKKSLNIESYKELKG